MKTLNYMVAIATASTLTMAACSNKAKTASESDDLDNLIEENTVTVKRNAMTDTTLTIGSTDMKFAEISRIFPVDSTGQFYLSIRAIIPSEQSNITQNLYSSLLDYYKQLGDTLDKAPAVAATPSQFAQAVDDLGLQFKAYASPYATDSVTPGFMMDIDMRPVYGAEGYMTYAIFEDNYTGGAHGDLDTYFETFNTATGQPYTFNDMFSAKGRDAIRKKLVDIIAKDKEMSVDDYLKALNEFLMPSTAITVDNFPVYHVGITSLGVVFTYPKYSIAAGFEGCPAYVIPLDEVASYLEPVLQ